MTKFLQDLLFNATLTVNGAVTLNNNVQIGNSRLDTHSVYGALTVGNGSTGTDITALTVLPMGTGGSVQFRVKDIQTGGDIFGVQENSYILIGADYITNTNGKNTITFRPGTVTGASVQIQAYSGNLYGTHSGLLVTDVGMNFGVSGGNSTVNYVQVAPTYNVTNAGSITLRGFYYSPIVTELGVATLNHYAWENTVGDIKMGNLAGTGTRMVVADSTGKLEVQAIPTFSETDTLNSVTTRGATTTNAITVGGLSIITASGGAGFVLNSTAGGGGEWFVGSYSSVNTISNALGLYSLTSDTTPLVITPTKLQVKNEYQFIWGFDDAGYADVGIPDAGIAWEAASTLKITNGSTGYGAVKLSNLIATGYLQVGDLAEIGTYDSGSGGNNINSYLSLEGHNNDGYGDGVVLKYSRGTKASPASVQTGDMLGGFYFKTYSNSLYANQSYIEAQVTGMGLFAKTNLMFATANGGNQGGFIWMTLNEDGKLHLASPTTWVDKGAYRLQVDGAIYGSGATLADLAGTGNRMVVASSSGVLSTQALPATITNYVTTDTTQTISGQKTFSALTTIFDSTQTSTFIEGRASGVLYGGISFGLFMQFNAYPGATQGYLWKNGLGSNVMALSQTGILNLATLAGTGTRMVVADTNGNLSVQSIPTGTLQGGVDADKTNSGSLSIGTTTVKSVSASTYNGAFFDYLVSNGTNRRVGTVVAVTNGTNVEYFETFSDDIGSTTGITFIVDLSAGSIRLRATTTGTGWTVVVSTRAI